LLQDGARRVAAGRAHDAAAGVAAGTAEIEAGDGRRVVCRARYRTQHEELVEGELAVMPVAAADPHPALDVGGREQLGMTTFARRSGAYAAIVSIARAMHAARAESLQPPFSS
jgi:hypothetical protein